ncbi:nuclear transport factor 2 family protein [Pseudomonas lopnurensis]|uniref:nuclear transport factor 2 family protein n=1 Tax=Pseudomonas lopnurensis TaxID=1477517 RepID=UPI0028AFCFA5|nr:nuclear transport factor 2 family protein [Pseudomonas lopnurensis]
MNDTTEANKALVRRYIQAVCDGDIETIESLQHPQAKWWILGRGELSRQSFLDGVRNGLLKARRRSVEITGITAEDDRVAYEARGEMVFTDDRVYRNQYHNLMVIREGLIVEGREYMDTQATVSAGLR